MHTSASSESSPRLWDRLAKSGCERWARCHFVEQDLDGIAAQWAERRPAVTIAEDEVAAGPSSSSASDVSAVVEKPDKTSSGPMTEPDPALEGGLPDMGGLSPSGHSLVYLSADAEEELQTLREDEVYIIGGIVDRNRYKVGPGSHPTPCLYCETIPIPATLQLCALHIPARDTHTTRWFSPCARADGAVQSLCQNKAERLEIRTAKLPIGKYIAHLPTRKVLTVNQVSRLV